jgi:hypothetical protein
VLKTRVNDDILMDTKRELLVAASVLRSNSSKETNILSYVGVSSRSMISSSFFITEFI